jgi:hypothetical protein
MTSKVNRADCGQCKTFEASAHEANCGMLYPYDEGKRASCVACGVYYSCGKQCAPVERWPKIDGCNAELLGLDPNTKLPEF